MSNGQPRRHRMDREGRLQSARDSDWVNKYSGKHIIQSYRKRYGVDILCAIKELRLLGVSIDQEYEQQVRQFIEGKARAGKRKKEEQNKTRNDRWGRGVGATFAYIAGYTSGGAPYGGRWDEVDEVPPLAEHED